MHQITRGSIDDLRGGDRWLLLTLVNGVLREQVREGMSLAGALAYVREGLDEEGVTAFDTESAAGRDRAVARTLAISLATLGEEERQRFARLAIFPDDTAIPLAVLERYWRLSPFRTKQLCNRLLARSLRRRHVAAGGPRGELYILRIVELE